MPRGGNLRVGGLGRNGRSARLPGGAPPGFSSRPCHSQSKTTVCRREGRLKPADEIRDEVQQQRKGLCTQGNEISRGHNASISFKLAARGEDDVVNAPSYHHYCHLKVGWGDGLWHKPITWPHATSPSTLSHLLPRCAV
jgi:hypothetical protein